MRGWRFYLAVALLALPPAALADRMVRYAIDPAQSQVKFEAGRSGFLRPRATFTQVSGTILGNLDHPGQSSVAVSIPVRSLESNLPLVRRRLIESGDFFRAREFPVMTFHSTGLQAIDSRRGTFRLVGQLTVNGVRQRIALDARLSDANGGLFDGDGRTGFTATTQISRAAFGMGRQVPLVGDTLYVDIRLVATRTSTYHAGQHKQRTTLGATAPARAGTNHS